MDFFGFHPLYVVILLALALIIFGPSRLPKLGAQAGRMLREFQAAREGLTQQMRDAFEEEEEEEPDFGPSSGPTVADDEAASEGAASTEGAVAVLDPPEGEAKPPEDEVLAAALNPPEPLVTSGEGPATEPISGEATAEGEATAAQSDAPESEKSLGEVVAAGMPDLGVQETPPAEVDDAAAAAPPVLGAVPEGGATGGVAVDSQAEEPAAVEPSVSDTTGSVSPEPVAAEPPAGAGDTPFASVAADRGTAPKAQEEDRRAD